METLFENYEMFLKEHSSSITSPSDAIKLIADKSMFESYIDALTTGLTPNIQNTVKQVCRRQRNMLLSEAANVPAATFGFGWTVLSLPILVDIYSEPIIAELCNVYTTESPIASIPRVRIHATTTNFDGTTSDVIVPTSRSLVRAGVVTDTVSMGEPYNALTETFGANSRNFKMNRRYLNVSNISITCTSSGGSTVTRNVTCFIRPDNRAQLRKDFTFLSSDSETVSATFHGSVDWDSGTLFYNVIINDMGDSTDTDITVNNATFVFRFTPVTTMVGRTKVMPKVETTDVTIDMGEDFLIDLAVEDIQDYKSIFKIDLAQTLSEAIKRQILLNKDYDLSYFLQAAQADIATNGASVTMDFDDYNGPAATMNYTPSSAIDVFKNIAPKIAFVQGTIKRNFNMYPQYIVSGLNTASMLRSLQDMLVSLPGVQGELGFSGSVASFLKLTVLESAAIPDNDIYLSTKAPQNALQNSTILDLIYMPLYIVTETTDGNARNFVRSRTMIDISRTEGLGYIHCDNLDKVFSE